MLARCALFLATPLFLLGVETTPATQQLHGHDLIHVSNCHPSMNEMTSYPSAYYPYAGRPWGWTSVYGYAYTMPPVTTTSPALQIDYTNVYTKPMKDIEFGLVARGVLIAEVRDVGTFSPGAEIKHKFGISENVFPIGTGLPQCVPLKITFEDGTKWKSPRLPALRQSAM
ncbi:MAG: hypothetical protein JOZ38_08520 [Candidatus Eremiobacteraeota bacterium]|nr:hypothetical protein [Candidatus Eremiobacteraeota bacterium]